MASHQKNDKINQYEVVQDAMRANGGYANLGHLYQRVVKLPSWTSESKTPFASIRRIVQDPRFFFRITPGLWGLKEAEAEIRAKLQVHDGPKQTPNAEFSHNYYQGLLVELGNFQKYDTCIDYHDQNRPFLSRVMSEVATLPNCKPFTYPRLVKKACSVDVIWFNQRDFPFAFFEVEHTTGIYNALLKFLEFQDFRIRFRIVADEARRPEFEEKVTGAAFQPIRDEIKFIDYKTVAKQHAIASEQVALGQI